MNLSFIQSPRKTTLRKILFQIHLWLGLLIALYAIVIGISGSILVFQEEIRRASLPHQAYNPSRIAPLPGVLENARLKAQNERLTFVATPLEPTPWWTLYYESAQGKTRVAYADAVTGEQFTHEQKLWIDWIQELHIYLLSGHTGFVVNCSMGIVVFIVAITGILIWWRGVKSWARGLSVTLHRGWKRANYDLHSAVGFWTLGIVLWWSMTAVYFLFPVQITAMINYVSPLVGMKQPPALTATKASSIASTEMILKSNAVVSHGFVSGIALPASAGDNITVYVDRKRAGDFSNRDINTFDGHTGQLLSSWHYGSNKSLGDWILWLVYPLHFGTLWGLPIKILWSFFGLCLVGLSISGVLMYWNRWLSKRLC